MRHFVKMLIWLGIMAVVGLIGLIVADHRLQAETPREQIQQRTFTPFDKI